LEYFLLHYCCHFVCPRLCDIYSLVLTYDAYSEALETQKQKESEVQILKEKHEQDMKSIREEMEIKFQQIFARIDTGKLS
jgi:hypothetical protein